MLYSFDSVKGSSINDEMVLVKNLCDVIYVMIFKYETLWSLFNWKKVCYKQCY